MSEPLDHFSQSKKSDNIVLLTVLSIVFVILLLTRIYIDSIRAIEINWSPYIPYFVLLLSFSIRRKITWFFGFVLAFYAIYYYLSIRLWIAYPRNIDFTLPIVEFFYGDESGYSTSSSIVSFLFVIPPIFYTCYFVIYLKIIIRLIINKRK